jgi:hypothetical protein
MPDWKPMDQLKAGHYATGLLSDGTEIGIFFDGRALWNITTGARADNVIRWQQQRLQPRYLVLEPQSRARNNEILAPVKI